MSRILTIDAGNTSLKGILWERERMQLGFRLLPSEAPAPDLDARLRGVDEVAGVAVPARRPALGWADLPPCRWVGEELPLPGEVLYERPEEMGPDRRVACWGALQTLGPSLVVDGGTALTLTHVDAGARMRGLAIGPGYGTLRRALGQAAPALEPFLGGETPGPCVLPESSSQNLAVGLEVGWAALVRGLLADARARLAAAGVEPGRLLFTGTDAPRAAAAASEGQIVACLVHTGLRLLAAGA